MPITVFTGLPGHGKTSFLVQHLLSEAKEAKRPIYAAGIDGLQPGLAAEVDPKRWHEPGVVEDGAIIYIDEAWKWFGHLHDASRAATPAHVLALAEHRHRGIDFYWTTQAPVQIYPFAREMIAEHHHVVRKFGTQLAEVFTWQELNSDLKSVTKRQNALRAIKPIPSESWSSFKSGTQHTIKAKLPWRLLLLPASLATAAVLLWFVVNWFKPDNRVEQLTGKQASAAPAAPTASGQPIGTVTSYANAADYHKLLRPRVADAPWTAPAFDGRAVQADPAVYCMASSAGTDGLGDHQGETCKCITEQGTPFPAGPETCRRIAREGAPYNPFKGPRQENEKRVMAETGHNPVAAPAATETLHAFEGTKQPYGSVATYGEFGLQ